MNTVNPYQAPEADVDVVSPSSPSGSLEDAIAGRYDFQIGEVMDEAWKLTRGFKASFWGAALVFYTLYFIAIWTVGKVIGEKPHFAVSTIANGLVGVLFVPLGMGLLMMAIRRAAGLPVSFSMVFGYFHKAGTAIVAALLSLLLSYAGLLFLLVPGIYLSLAYGMTQPLVADRGLGAWQAMETSRKALSHTWFRIFALYLVVGLLTGLSALPLAIPLIWTAPWCFLVIGVLYRRIFGVAGSGDLQTP